MYIIIYFLIIVLQRYFRVINDHKVNALFTVPTALRVIKREDPEGNFRRKYNLKSLRNVFIAGEHCDYETKAWAEQTLKVPILNHWWQTETGHSITATCLGLGHSLSPPKHSAGMRFPGYDGKHFLLICPLTLLPLARFPYCIKRFSACYIYLFNYSANFERR